MFIDPVSKWLIHGDSTSRESLEAFLLINDRERLAKGDTVPGKGHRT